ncbi:hypothetical protein Syun_028369 [Stephania yunnanensis]|uniref:Uncharacterized protein n=1 Tax=Stephania yunnanensis TaxID=152371 RepID=A0AAP0EPK7_9MAGN
MIISPSLYKEGIISVRREFAVEELERGRRGESRGRSGGGGRWTRAEQPESGHGVRAAREVRGRGEARKSEEVRGVSAAGSAWERGAAAAVHRSCHRRRRRRSSEGGGAGGLACSAHVEKRDAVTMDSLPGLL